MVPEVHDMCVYIIDSTPFPIDFWALKELWFSGKCIEVYYKSRLDSQYIYILCMRHALGSTWNPKVKMGILKKKLN